MRQNIKIRSVIKNVIWSEDTLMNKTECHSNCFFFFNFFAHNQAEQIKKGAIVSKFC